MSNAEFLQRLTAIMNDARKEGVSEVLLNYTPAGSLCYLVGPEADIACSSVVYQDDPREIVTGAQRFVDWLVNAKVFSAAHGEALNKKVDAIVKKGKELWPYTPYVFCLTARVDDPCFWCRFARDGGYAVGIDRNKLVEYYNRINERSASSSPRGRLMYLMPVLYLESDRQYISHYLELMYQQRRDDFDRYAQGEPSADCNEVLAQILVAAAIIKDEKYAVEREWRLVLHPTFADVKEAEDSLARAIEEKQEKPKPRLKTGIFRLASRDLRDVIRCIWVSSRGNQTVLHARVQKQLGALVSPLQGGEIVGDGLPFVRNSTVAVPTMHCGCSQVPLCPDADSEKCPLGGRTIPGGWNRSTGGQPTDKGKAKAPSWRRGVIAGAVIVALGALCLWLFSGNGDKPEPRSDKKSGLIKAVAPAVTNKPTTVEKGVRYTKNGKKIVVPKNPWGTPIPKDLEYKPHWEYTPEDYARIDPGYEARHKQFLEKQKNRKWKNHVDLRLANLLFSDPGKPNILQPFRPNFKDMFLKSLSEPIIVSKDDPPELKEQKRQLIEAKAWLKDQVDSGADIVEILNNEQKNMAEVRGLHDNLVRELHRLQNEAKSPDEIEDFVNAANIMLKEKGGGKVRFSTQGSKLLIEHRLKQQNNGNPGGGASQP